MSSRNMTNVYKLRKLFNLFVSIIDQMISTLPKNSTLALLDPDWKSVTQSEFDVLIKNSMWIWFWDLVMLISLVVCGFSDIKRNLIVVLVLQSSYCR